MRQAIRDVVDRHEALRTTISGDGQEQRVAQTISVDVALLDCGISSIHRKTRLTNFLESDGNALFDLTQGPLFKATLVKLEQRDHVLALVAHHIIVDGWSMGVLVRDIAAAYTARLGGFRLTTEPPLQFRDYASWLNDRLADASIQDHESYWLEHLSGPLPQLELPGKPRPPAVTFRGARHIVKLEAALVKRLNELSQQNSCTPFMTLLAGYLILLHRLSGQDDLIVGAPVSKRGLKGGGDLVGYCVNVVPIRSRFCGNLTFKRYLAELRSVLIEAYKHADYPFSKLVSRLNVPRDPSRPQLVATTFNMNAPLAAGLTLPGLEVELMESPVAYARLDVSVNVVPIKDELLLEFDYNPDLFDAAAAERIAQRLVTVYQGVVSDPEQRVSSLSILTEKERHQLLVEWNATRVDFPKHECLHHLFEAQVEKTPEATAVVFEDQSLTYAALNARANKLAHHLRALGVGPDVPVGICMERSLEMIVSLFGILKAGGAYVPLDPDYPEERLGFMLEDTRVPVVLTQDRLRDRLPRCDALKLALDKDWGLISEAPSSAPAVHVAPQNLAYVIYTSGSTGKPKGASIPHAGIVNRLLWMQAAYGLDETDRVLQKTPFSFDVSVWEFFWPLMTGARLVVAKPGGHKDSRYLAELIAEAHITTLHFVPPMLAAFLEEPGTKACNSLCRVICSGEALPLELMQRHYARLDVPLHNLYGPTEASVDVTYWGCERDTKLSVIPIGRPIANTQLYILDSELNPVPVGVTGELYIGGVGLARGYFNRPDLTAEKFIPDLFSDAAGARFYRTGDVARFLADGSIEFLGRSDHQVKIRGFRIELGEVEATLALHPAVREVVVVTRDDGPSDKRLVAYVVPKPDATRDVSALRALLKEKLPDYMVPTAFVYLDALPLSHNGKVDRKALPAPEAQPQAAQPYVAPRTQSEKRLADIWAQVLGTERVGIHANSSSWRRFDPRHPDHLPRQSGGVQVGAPAALRIPPVAGLAG
jgi:amino acid adenylation domain-containing protein